VTRSGAIAIAVITIGTLVIAFISGFAVDLLGDYSRISGQSIPESLVSPRFWGIVFGAMFQPQSLISLLLAAAFGALGCFGILRGAFRQTAAQPAAGAVPTSYTMPSTTDPSVPPPPAAPGVVLNGEPVAPTPDEPREPHDKK
jgi:hypothetical protein